MVAFVEEPKDEFPVPRAGKGIDGSSGWSSFNPPATNRTSLSTSGGGEGSTTTNNAPVYEMDANGNQVLVSAGVGDFQDTLLGAADKFISGDTGSQQTGNISTYIGGNVDTSSGNVDTSAEAAAANLNAAGGGPLPETELEKATRLAAEAAGSTTDTSTAPTEEEKALLASTNPELAAGAEHTFTELKRTEGDRLDPTDPGFYRDLEDVTQFTPPPALSPVEMEAAQVDVQNRIDEVGYEASLVTAAESGDVTPFLMAQVPDAIAAQMTAITGEVADRVAAQIDIDRAMSSLDSVPAQMQAVIAALPHEALVTSQMDTLLAGLEGGNVPLWARPAIEHAEAMMASRGLGRSTVGRDAMFNAIIGAAMPLAQSNATALQQRSSENLGYANRANEINAGFQQELKMQLNDAQTKFIGLNAQLANDMELANLSKDVQMEMINLEHLNAAEKENMTAENETRLANLRKDVETGIQNSNVKTEFGIKDLDNQQRTVEANAIAKNKVMFEKLDFILLGDEINLKSKNETEAFVIETQQTADIHAQTITLDYDTLNSKLLENAAAANIKTYTQIIASNATQDVAANMWNTAGDNAVNASNVQGLFGLSTSAIAFLQNQDNNTIAAGYATGDLKLALASQFLIAQMQFGEGDYSDDGGWEDIFDTGMLLLNILNPKQT